MQLKSTQTVWITPIATFLGLIALTWVAYYDSLNVVFHFDDIPFILQNKDLPNFDKIFNDLLSIKDSRRAIPQLTLHWNLVSSGQNVTSFHVFNICLHALNAFLIFLLSSRLLSNAYVNSSNRQAHSTSVKFAAISVAVVFAVHPLLTASVTYISQRSGQLATFFYVSAFLCYLQMRRSTFRQKTFWAWFVLTIFCAWLAFKSKEMALTWPLIPFIYEIIFRLKDREQLLRVIKWAAGLLLLFIALITWYLLNTSYLTGNYFVGFGSKTLWGPWTHVQTMSRVLLEYWKLMIFPLHQWMNIDHDFAISRQSVDFFAFAGFAFHLSLTAVTLFIAKKGRPLFAFGFAWFYVAFGPYIVIPERDLMVEYKAYLPSVSIFLILADLIFWLRQKKFLRLYLFGGMAIVMILGIMGTINRNKDYYTTASVWKDAINKAPNKARTLHNLGYAYAQNGHHSAAKVYFQKSLQMSPGFVLARLNLARVYIRQSGTASTPEEKERNMIEGIMEYQMMLNVSGLFPTNELTTLVRDAHYELGEVYRTRNEDKLAIQEFERALKMGSDVRNYIALGKIYMKLKDFNKAREYNTQVLNVYPNAPEIIMNMGVISLQEQKLDEALEWFLKVLQFSPNNPDIYNNLGIIHSMKGNALAGMQAFKKALEINPKHEKSIQNLKALEKAISKK
ncbi:MAG: tetratricopeptide repeat protein [SAR324 cluster bacterium]|nr:tetratricopeptide repeat protein [SAR324 cluster bacterium]